MTALYLSCPRQHHPLVAEEGRASPRFALVRNCCRRILKQSQASGFSSKRLCNLPVPPSLQQLHSRPSICILARRSRRFGSREDAETSRPEPQEQLEFQEEFADALTSGSLEISKISSNVRSRVEQAMEKLNCRATVGDAAGAAGLQLEEAEAALNALAADTLGTLEVSEAGDILYVLPPDFKARLRNRSLALRVEPALKGLRAAASYLSRITFGTTLILSLTLVWLAVLFVQSGGDQREHNRRSSGGFAYYSATAGNTMYVNLNDILWFWDPWYYRRHQSRLQQGQRPGYLEGIFSFVFGDGNPNQGYEERRWQAVGQLITSKKGVVTAEELGPYLDVTAANVRGEHNDGEVLDEGFVVPALIRFGGTADVDDNGNILYRFPSFQKTAQSKVVSQPSPSAAQQALWKLSNASSFQIYNAIALGVANLVGVFLLSYVAGTPRGAYTLANSSLGFMKGLLPYLQVYAVAFFAIPLVRMISNERKNAAINAQNAFRSAMQKALANPSLQLKLKLEHARQIAEQKVLSERDMIYSSGHSSSKQGRSDLDDFDSRLDKNRSASDRIASDDKYRITP